MGFNPLEWFENRDQNTVTINRTQTPEVGWGGADGAAANEYSGMARSNLNAATGRRDAWTGQATDQWAAPQAQESQWISNQEQAARAGDQAGAMQLVRERAMGLGPSEAAFQLQAGLDKSLAQQSAIAGSARGQAALAAAQGNAAAAQGNLQQQAFTEAGRLRAQEMANAQNMYGMMAGQQRAQDQARLGMANQMAQRNAGLRSQHMGMMGSLLNQADQSAQGWAGVEARPWDQQLQADMQGRQLTMAAHDAAENRRLGITQGNIDRKRQQQDNLINTALSLGKTAFGAAAGQATPKPPGG